jgi:hypothetical protein
MLFLKLTPAEADEYLRARRDQGFNAIQVMLTGFLGMTNRAGQFPFTASHDFSQPDEKYFAHVDSILEKAWTQREFRRAGGGEKQGGKDTRNYEVKSGEMCEVHHAIQSGLGRQWKQK